MNDTGPSPSQLLAARREVTVCATLLAAAAVVVVLAARGTFHSMMMFPLVFAAVASVVALWTLFSARGVFRKTRLAMVAAVIVVSAAGAVVHERAFTRMLRGIEREGLEALGGRAAPEIPFVRAFHFDPGRSGPLTFGERPTLVHFWSTSCDPCIEEIPALKRFWNEHRDAGLDFVSVTRLYSEGAAAAAEIEQLEQFIEHYDLEYPTLVGAADSPAHRDYRVRSFPSTVLIDRDGILVAYGAGISGTARLMELARDRLGRPGE